MDGLFTLARRVAVLAVAILSLALGLALVYLLITPENVRAIRTSGLLLVLGLFILPVVSLIALWIDCLAAEPRQRAGSARLDAQPPQGGAIKPVREVAHPAGRRPTRFERRRLARVHKSVAP